MTQRTLAAMLLTITLTACLTSRSPSTVAREDSQHGEIITVQMDGGEVHTGELLALDDSSVVLLTQHRVAIGALSRVYLLSFEDFVTRDVGAGRRLPAHALQRGKESSRFPYGISATAMAQLLANAKQAAPARLEATRP